MCSEIFYAFFAMEFLPNPDHL